MNKRFRIPFPSLNAWVQALLMTGAVVMTALIVNSPDVMWLVA